MVFILASFQIKPIFVPLNVVLISIFFIHCVHLFHWFIYLFILKSESYTKNKMKQTREFSCCRRRLFFSFLLCNTTILLLLQRLATTTKTINRYINNNNNKNYKLFFFSCAKRYVFQLNRSQNKTKSEPVTLHIFHSLTPQIHTHTHTSLLGLFF